MTGKIQPNAPVFPGLTQRSYWKGGKNVWILLPLVKSIQTQRANNQLFFTPPPPEGVEAACPNPMPLG